jgi:hypothetical protein
LASRVENCGIRRVFWSALESTICENYPENFSVTN